MTECEEAVEQLLRDDLGAGTELIMRECGHRSHDATFALNIVLGIKCRWGSPAVATLDSVASRTMEWLLRNKVAQGRTRSLSFDGPQSSRRSRIEWT
ncbi:hypothetical protein [Burkholderia contaminans]|uniref:hypothetical protein n=1 Tax=Burkholderia contaminans TaxID=488447 RepID=UPI0012601E44|nr:hypothetical protein [Burkholderia contaminans]